MISHNFVYCILMKIDIHILYVVSVGQFLRHVPAHFQRSREQDVEAAGQAAVVQLEELPPLHHPLRRPPPRPRHDHFSGSGRWGSNVNVCGVELQANLRENYVKFYNHGEGPL